MGKLVLLWQNYSWCLILNIKTTYKGQQQHIELTVVINQLGTITILHDHVRGKVPVLWWMVVVGV